MRIIKVSLLLVLLFLSNSVYAPLDANFVTNLRIQSKIDYFNELGEAYRADQFKQFLTALGKYESGNNPAIWNKWGYIGKYQFGRMARKSTGCEHVTYSNFKKDPSIWPEWEQEIAMRKLLMKNQVHLGTTILQYDGKLMIDGVVVTKSGMLAAAHLAGAYGVKKYFATNGRYNPTDACGTSLETYLLLFSGYKF